MKRNFLSPELSPRPSYPLVLFALGLGLGVGLGGLLGRYQPAGEPSSTSPAAIAIRAEPVESPAAGLMSRTEGPRIGLARAVPSTKSVPTSAREPGESPGQGPAAEAARHAEQAEAAFRQRWAELETSDTERSPTMVKAAICEARLAREDALRQAFDDPGLLAYELENTQLVRELASQTRRLELTSSETTEMISLEKEAADLAMAAALGADTSDAPEQWQAQEDRKKSLLGPERYDRYERLKDPVYQALEDLANQRGLDPEVASKALEAHRAFASVVTRTAGDPEAIQAVTLGGVAAARQAHVQRMISILGTEGAQLYVETILSPDLSLDRLLDSASDDLEPAN